MDSEITVVVPVNMTNCGFTVVLWQYCQTRLPWDVQQLLNGDIKRETYNLHIAKQRRPNLVK